MGGGYGIHRRDVKVQKTVVIKPEKRPLVRARHR
jgi:hypothetical protein